MSALPPVGVPLGWEHLSTPLGFPREKTNNNPAWILIEFLNFFLAEAPTNPLLSADLPSGTPRFRERRDDLRGGKSSN